MFSQHDNCLLSIRRLQSLAGNKKDFKGYIYTNVSCYATVSPANDGVSKVWQFHINMRDVTEPTKPLLEATDVLEVQEYKDASGVSETRQTLNIEAIKKTRSFYRIIARAAQ